MDTVIKKNIMIVWLIGLFLYAALFMFITEHATNEMFQDISQTILIVVASLMLFSAILMIVLTKGEYSFSMLLSLYIYHHAFMKVVYVSDDLIIYNNKILKIKDIDKYEKESRYLGNHIRYWINGNSYVLKIDNIFTRDKIYDVLKSRIV